MENLSGEERKGKHSSSELERCAKTCSECYEVCVKTVQYCLKKGGDHAEASHINLLNDCLCICATSADFLLRGSDNHVATCTACAEICSKCAEECRTMESDPQMKKCAEACEKCAESCERMSAH